MMSRLKLKSVTAQHFAAMRGARRVHGALFSLSFVPCVDGPRVACVVSKKTARLAVQRNLVKRRCREAVRAATPCSRLCYVLTAKNQAVAASYAAVREDVARLLREAEALCSSSDTR